MPKNRTGQHRYRTDRDVVDAVRELARCLPDAHIARVLNRLGYQTGRGNSWTQTRITSLRSTHGIAVFALNDENTSVVTMAQAAVLLQVSPTTVRRLIERSILPATQVLPHAPWLIQRADLEREAVQDFIRAIRRGQSLPRTHSANQLSLANSGT